jgi:signal transduction histidine kinase
VAVARARTRREIHTAAMHALSGALGANHAAVIRAEPWNSFRFVATDGVPAPLARSLERALRRIARAKRREPVFIPDLSDRPRTAAGRLLVASGVRALGVVTVPDAGTGHSKLAVYFDEPHRFADEEIRYAHAVAAYVALGLERLRTEQELRQSREGLRTLSARLEHAREEERARLARELHDELGQLLTSFKMDLSWLTSELARAPGQPTLEIANKLQCMAGLTEVGISTVRQIASELRPPALDHLGLPEALRWEAGMFEQRTGIRCRVHADLADPALDASRATAVFRIVQEALTNVARHAAAGAVRVSLRATPRAIVLEVKDNGRGISADAIDDPRSVGLLGMRERARLAGGSIEITGARGRGTRIIVRVPAGRTGGR